MVESNLPFDRDRFLRDLPELLCGREPILDRPVARRWMRESPEGRRAVREIVGAVAILEDAPTRIVGASAIDARSLRSIELAGTHFRVRLASVLRDLLNHDIIVGSTAQATVIESIDHGRHKASGSREDIVDRASALVASCQTNQFAMLDRTERGEISCLSSPSEPRKLLEAIRRLDAVSNDEYAHHLLLHGEGEQVRVEQLESLARNTQDLDVAARAATMCSMLRGDAGDYHASVEAAYFGVRYSANSSIAAYNGLLYALLAGRVRDAARFLDNLTASLELLPCSLEAFRLSFLGDARYWRVVMCRFPAMVGRIMAILGSAK